LLTTVVQSCSLDKAKRDLYQAKADVKTCVGVNEVNSGVIASLEAASQECVAGREADERKFNAVALSWEGEKARLEGLSKLIQTERIEVYRDPTCADFAKLDIGAVCPGLRDSLRKQAERYYGVQGSGGDSTGEDTDTGEPAGAP
jgi:hypothetical protein